VPPRGTHDTSPGERPGGSRLHRTKTSDAVVDHVIDLLFSGRLRAGDRIDLTAIADDLGVSRAPVREALVVLERDGLVTIPFHKGAFVSRFDAETLHEAFELYGMLSALGSSRVARGQDSGVLAALGRIVAEAGAAASIEEWEQHARAFRRTVNLAVAGSRLRSLLRTFSGLVPAASRLSLPRSVDGERELLQREYDAMLAGDPHDAASAVIEHLALIGDIAVQTLRERGILEPAPASRAHDHPALRALVALDPPFRGAAGNP